MPDSHTYRPVYKALHRPLTIGGVDRRLFFLALLLGAATVNRFYSLWAGSHDPEMLRILLASARHRDRYDPGKCALVHLEVRRC